jgi:hypothetical protein
MNSLSSGGCMDGRNIHRRDAEDAEKKIFKRNGAKCAKITGTETKAV